jgi:DNA polymerase-3 subunit alpha (Gram-positive type)
MGSLDTYVALDIEATGISPNKSRIIEIGAIKIKDGKEVGRFESLVNPCVPISEEIENLTGITKEMVKGAREAKEVLKEFIEFCEDYPWLGHSINSDFGYIKAELMKYDMVPKGFMKYGYDTLALSRMLLPNLEKKTLAAMCEYYGINNKSEHRAMADVEATVELFEKLKKDFYKDKKDVFKLYSLAYKVKKIQKITIWQKNYLNDLIKYHKIDFSGCVDELTMGEASRIIDKIILKYGIKR